MARPLSDSDVQQIQTEIFAGRKIQAIKLYRDATGDGLKDAKDAVDAMADDLRHTSPDRFTAAKAGCMGMILLLLVPAVMAAWHFA